MLEQNGKTAFLKKAGKWGPILGIVWIGSHILVPLALFRVPTVQKYLVVLQDKLPFNIPGIG
tara:strand:+ start:317 stop:502 length:186 start_codon:yes stop_codon:yes gene_type:complete